MPDKNILSFPKERIVRDAEVAKILDGMNDKGNKNAADHLVNELLTNLLLEIQDTGIDTNVEQFDEDFVYLTGIFQALIYRAMDVEHPLHKSMDEQQANTTHDPN